MLARPLLGQVLYWIGVAAAGACLGAIVLGHTPFGSHFENARTPLEWIAGAVALVALSVAEYCHTAAHAPGGAPATGEAKLRDLPAGEEDLPASHPEHAPDRAGGTGA